MIRAIALSLALLIGVGAIVPLMTDYSHAESRRSVKKTKKKKIKKYSKAWWKRYYARQKRKKATIAYRRALRARQILLARKKREKAAADSAQVATAAEKPVVRDSAPAVLPTGETAPQRWQRGLTSTSELQYQINDNDGKAMGAAAITVVGAATGPDSDDFRNRAVGGVPTASLRRTVIDKMMREDGWVVNDYHKVINGKKVYVVVGQSTVKGVIQSRMFYFTEVGGRIYSLATSAPDNLRDRLAEESERVIQSLQRDKNSTKAGLK